MSEFKKRMSDLGKQWKKTKGAGGGGGLTRVAPGKYQGELKKAVFDPKECIVRWTWSIIRGEFAGTPLHQRSNLLYEPKDKDKDNGLSFFKGQLETLGVELNNLDEASIKKALKSLIGCVADLFVTHKGQYQNTFVNGLVNANATEEEEEEEIEEDDEVDSDEDDSDEDEVDAEVEEPAFPDGTKVTFVDDEEVYNGKYLGIDEDTPGNSIVSVDDEEWSVETNTISQVKEVKKKRGRPKGSKNKPKKAEAKKPEPEPEPETDTDDDDEWEDSFDD